ncbi:hypothetical protein BH18ACI5_BH18ACI5_22980 [soil metagenome]
MSGWPRSHWTRAAIVAVFLSVLHTWPLATAPGTLSRNDNGDAMLNEWIVAWVQHQLPRHPLDLFQANIFYPAADSLAFSEPLIVPAILGSPVRLAGGSPVLVNNLLLLVGLTLTMLAMYALIREWTGDEVAALVAGAAFAFNTHTLMRLAHLQAMHAYGMPLALLAADRVLTMPRMRDAGWLALWMSAMAYTSGYFFVFAFFLIVIAIVVRAPVWTRIPRQVVPRLALATGVTALAVLPLSIPYRRVAIEQHMVRSLDNVAEYSAPLGSYLASAGKLHEWLWSVRMFDEPLDAFFPGFAVLVLSICAFAFLRPDTRAAVAMLVFIAITGVVMSLGTRTPAYAWIYHVFPPLTGIRAAGRFGLLFLFGMAGLAGFGLWQARLRLSPRRAALVGGIAVLLVTVEAFAGPMTYLSFGGIPRLYDLLAKEPAGVVLVEQPFYPPEAVFENAEYVLNSTAHWRPLMNGYSGYMPQTYRDFTRTFWFFPRPHAIDAMQAAGVTHVMVHPSRFGDEADRIIAMCDAEPRLQKMAVGRYGLTLYRLLPANPVPR